jgi:xylulose-5-phosphate/fructose-6-phosphate phosphoketolase
MEGNLMNAATPISNLGLAADELDKLNAYWRACKYLAAGMIFLRDVQIECRNYAYENGVDLPEADDWVWPY